MSLYSISIFLHIVGALGLFIGIGLEQASLANLRRADTTARVREWTNVLGGLRRIEGPAALVILVTGVYMMETRWAHQAWIALALIGMVVMAVLGIAITGRRTGRIVQALPAVDGRIPPTVRAGVNDPVLRAASTLRAALALGIVFLMSVKPGASGALAALGVALVLGASVTAAANGWFGGRRAEASSRFGTES